MRSRSLYSDMARQKGTENREKKRSQSLFPQIDIIEDEDTENLGEYVKNDQIVDTLKADIGKSSSTALSSNSRMTTSHMLKDAEKKRKLKRENINRKRATVMVKSGAMTFLVIAVTLVTASFLMSPTIERIFGG